MEYHSEKSCTRIFHVPRWALVGIYPDGNGLIMYLYSIRPDGNEVMTASAEGEMNA